MKSELKKLLYKQCLDFVEARLNKLKNAINEIQESLESETKSSAADKYETGRAMLQIENEKLGFQFEEIKTTKETLKKIDTTKISKTVGLGSIVYTTKNNYFISISAGQIIAEDKTFYAISLNSPIGQALLLKTVDDEIIFREEKIKIKKII